jgi:hypothetical protein
MEAALLAVGADRLSIQNLSGRHRALREEGLKT